MVDSLFGAPRDPPAYERECYKGGELAISFLKSILLY